MAFLQLNGWTIAIRVGTPSLNYNELGARGRAAGGQYRSTRRALKRRWPCRTTLLSAAKARALKGLLFGEGHYWSFDSDLLSNKGLAPEAGHDVTQPAATAGKYSNAIKVNSGGDIAWDLGYTGDWTIACWRCVENAPTFAFLGATFPAGDFTLSDPEDWTHLAVDSNGNKYESGSANAGLSTDWLDVTSGVFTLQDTSHEGEYCYDELLIVPWIMPAAQITALATLPWAYTGPPSMAVSGSMVRKGDVDAELLPTESMDCVAELGQARCVPFSDSDGWHDEGQVLEFTLVET